MGSLEPNRRQWRNWGDNPVVVAILALAGIATIASMLDLWFEKLGPQSQPVMDAESESQQTLKVASAGYPQEIHESKPDVPPSSPAAGPAEAAPDEADIVWSCNWDCKGGDEWLCLCEFRNNSSRIVWGREFVDQEGAQLGWYCNENSEGSCAANSAGALRFDHYGRPTFNFVNPGESLHFFLSCPVEPRSCRFYGRAPGLVIQEAEFYQSKEDGD